eukprot:TRINITY_DN7539_c0_g1_i2.p1 TRINITY_DN7539_c0_g1~~TRINITY_DN7539_c0_g1_i2.p1  ORF type:complete len:446 (+),score=84.13 TRINITY_DN7539_c0_g1_i2:51-1388(+)
MAATTTQTQIKARLQTPSQRTHVTGFYTAGIPATPEQWLEEKNQRDRALADIPTHLWQVHDRLYDLTPYLDKHPGGRHWLERTQGSDITVFFETHHLNIAKVRAILSKYRVSPSQGHSQDAQAYTWKQGDFYDTVRAKAAEVLRNTGTGPTSEMLFLSWSAVAIFAASFVLTAISGSYLAAIFTGITLLVMMGIGHNFLHQQDRLLRFALDLSVFGHHEWRISHVLSHHSYPNLDIDIEASQLEPWATFMRNQPKNNAIAYVTWVVAFAFIPLVELARCFITTVTGKGRVEFAIKPIQLAILIHFNGYLHGFGLFWLMHDVAFWLLFTISFPVHRSEYGWTEGCQPVVDEQLDFGRHTVQTTQDYATGYGLVAKIFVFGSFNDHIAHHLFPTVDLSKQALVRPVILAAMKEHNVPYTQRSYWQLLRSTVLNYRLHDNLFYTPNCK